MSAGQWTAGPWQWVGADEIEQVEHPFTSVADAVRIYGDNEHTQRSANARLIAAAPDLYEALDKFVDRSFVSTADIEFARAALARARGETL